MGVWGDENEFLKNYQPAKISFPLSTEINNGTHVYLNHVRRSLANLRKAYEQLHGLPQDGLRMAEDLIAYKKLFPNGKPKNGIICRMARVLTDLGQPMKAFLKDEDGISRFIEAQKGDYEEALAEIEVLDVFYGGKRDSKTLELLNRQPERTSQ